MKHTATQLLIWLRAALLLLGLTLIATPQSASAVINIRSITITAESVPVPVLSFANETLTVDTSRKSTNQATSTLSGGSYGTISYSSANTAIATVDASSGEVTGIAGGTSVITATQAAVAGVNTEATKTYTVTVRNRS